MEREVELTTRMQVCAIHIRNVLPLANIYTARNVYTLQKQEGCFNQACLPQLQFKDQKQSSCFVHALKNMRVVFET